MVKARVLACWGLGVLALTIGPTAEAQESSYKVSLLARVPDPGAPEGVALGPDGLIYTATFNQANGVESMPARVFGFSPEGKLVRDYEIRGQKLNEAHGLTGLVFDAEERIYVVEPHGLRVLRLDPRGAKVRQEVYGTFRDLEPCNGTNGPDCSPGSEDFPSETVHPAFGPDGALYVGDALQGVIWRIPRGGGPASVWLADERLQPGMGAPFFGPGGLRLMPDGRTLMVTTLAQRPQSNPNSTAGVVWTVPILPNGGAGGLEVFWESRPFDGPFDIEFGQSGKVYVSDTVRDVFGGITVLSSTGKELARFPSAAENQLLEVPFDHPFGIAIDQYGRLIAANNSFLLRKRSSWALLAVEIGDPGVPPLRPRIGPTQTGSTQTGSRRPARLRIRVAPRKVKAGRRTTFRFRVLVRTSEGVRPVPGARVRIDGRRVRTNRRGRARVRVRLRRSGLLRVRACRKDFGCARATVRVKPSRSRGAV